ncbi:AAA family ATPase [Natronosporangium hydrolyticum]|uniref:AAA family ATPase n=1 Tax=Natronosporangium hydrolyticum TaxID=2811111 RepID=UPI001EFA0D98|nr:AAA family ATPase [Natronosporangium hydrolyticum]
MRQAALDARRGVVRLPRPVLSELGLRPGDPVRLTGRRETAALVAPAEAGTGGRLLYADDLVLGNLGTRDGGTVTLHPVARTPATEVVLSGPAEVVAAVSPELLRLALLGKAITAGDNVSLLPLEHHPNPDAQAAVGAARKSLQNLVGYAWTTALLTVEAVGPQPVCVVATDTAVGWQHGPATHPHPGSGGSVGSSGAAAMSAAPATATTTAPPSPAESSAARPPEPPPKVEDLPGLRAQAHELAELLDLGFQHSEVLDKLGTSVNLGVLVAGPAGSGKATLVKAVAAQVGVPVTEVWAPELAASTNDAAAARLREAASGDRPRVLLITDVEALAPREQPGPLGTVLRQRIRELTGSGAAAVVCTTAHPEGLDPGLRAPDLLSLQLAVPLPDTALRAEQLAVLTRPMPLHEEVSLAELAALTPGFVAADLRALAREAAVRAARRQRDAANPEVTMADFEAARSVISPSSMAEASLELDQITLDEVGDLAEVKEALTETVLWPLTYPDTFARLGVQPPRGVLLYGPPGCGKTFLVKAIAGTGKANVLSVKGAELLTKWVGESERAVRELFRRAREAAPTLVFLDEVDALAPVRGQASDGGTTDRVVAALLTELDGVEALRNVVVIGATNRPDLVDPALLRPGRLERLVYVPPPDAEARTEILRAASRDVPLADDVDLADLADQLDGFSAADCAALIREAGLSAMRESMTASTVTAEHVETARQRVRASLDPAQVAHLAAYADQHSRAS